MRRQIEGEFVPGAKFARLDRRNVPSLWNISLMNETTPILRAISPAPSRIAGVFLAVFGAAFFATKGIFIKLALLENVDVLTTLTWRMILSAPVFVAIGYWGHRDNLAKGRTGKLTGGLLVRSALVGALGYYVASYLDFKGLEFVTVQFDRLILMTYPIFVVLISAVVLKTKITGKMIGALGLSYAGLTVIFLRDLSELGQEIYLGGALVLGAALAFACYQILAKPVIDQIGARVFTSMAM
ncbi:MAG TPA: EamA family transporter, partial [Devosia sp.]|nr:EamA family transporter [Devosia sp.]